MILDLIPDEDERLHTPIERIELPNGGTAMLEALVSDMFETMKFHNGVGLAANQCGVPIRLFVMDTRDHRIAAFNPIVEKVNGVKVLMPEGCLSYPGMQLKIKRLAEVKLTYQDIEGNAHSVLLDGLAARCALHETDHLDGIVFLDRVSKMKLDIAKKNQKRG